MKRLRLFSSACTVALMGTGCLFAQEVADLGYSDIRFSIGTAPTDGWSGGAFVNDPNGTVNRQAGSLPAGFTTPNQKGSFDSGFRISAMWIGPMCGILPIGCGTAPRTTPTSDIPQYTSVEDSPLLNGEDFNPKKSSFTYDLLVGFEASINMWSVKGSVAPGAGQYGADYFNPALRAARRSRDNNGDGLIDNGTAGADYFQAYIDSLAQAPGAPKISMVSGMADVYLGWSWESRVRSAGRWQFEALVFGGFGMAQVDWTDGATGQVDDDLAPAWEVGARMGMYYVWPKGTVIGAHLGYRYTDVSATIFNRNVDLSTSGIYFGVEMGYRF